ncbi:hypothetical protein COY90_00445 [Candidatus Roizmanbacteria bacterium CG_4_10_14_0_8_um_filter_39_9]|uniref:Carbohydrate kinase PfkB domain-containing protein n=1 Tax=Candidatus Roizmanbacteria bacterium CG_4_10_14_0_8_um_filter_39_9 TaxID=1974829 RepID=A0A2M7QEY2_9BACT|nr:MAG: hypothetical protein COY90_00445 [Candidatus Roizmanbacteria bacterium CG_4_10_14_0_8_um_filter_39_9]
MKAYPNVIVTGSLSWDIIMDFPSNFIESVDRSKLHELNLNFVVSNLEKQMGGTATNIAYGVAQTLSLIREPVNSLTTKVSVAGGLGKDGKEHLAFFKKNKIDTKGIVMDKTRFSASGSVITDIKNNQIWGFYYGAGDKGKDVEFKKIVKRNDVMIISANHPQALLAAQRFAISHNIAYMYDVGMALGWIKDSDLRKGIRHAKWLIGNDFEVGTITKRLGKPTSWIVGQGVDVISTLGEKGVIYETNDKSQITNNKPALPAGRSNSNNKTIRIPSIKLKKVVDPTGAGDAWRGGFISSYCYGLDIVDCLAMGNAVASFAVETYGTINYKLRVTELRKRLRSINGLTY